MPKVEEIEVGELHMNLKVMNMAHLMEVVDMLHVHRNFVSVLFVWIKTLMPMRNNLCSEVTLHFSDIV